MSVTPTETIEEVDRFLTLMVTERDAAQRIAVQAARQAMECTAAIDLALLKRAELAERDG